MGQKCTVTFIKDMKYYSTASSSYDGFDNNKYMYKSHSRVNEQDNYDVKLEIVFGKGLTHVLGIDSNKIEFEIKHSNSK